MDFPVSSVPCMGPGAVLSAQEQHPATASSPGHHSQQSKLPSGIRSAASGAVKEEAAAGITSDQCGSRSHSWEDDPVLSCLGYCSWCNGHNFLLVLSLCLPPDSFRQQGLIDPASLLPEAALFLLSLLPLLLINTLLHTPLFGIEHLPALIY